MRTFSLHYIVHSTAVSSLQKIQAPDSPFHVYVGTALNSVLWLSLPVTTSYLSVGHGDLTLEMAYFPWSSPTSLWDLCWQWFSGFFCLFPSGSFSWAQHLPLTFIPVSWQCRGWLAFSPHLPACCVFLSKMAWNRQPPYVHGLGIAGIFISLVSKRETLLSECLANDSFGYLWGNLV